MEEVKGSNPFRSTKTFQTLTGLGPSEVCPPESKWSPNLTFMLGQAWAPCEILFLPTIRLIESTRYVKWAVGTVFSLVCLLETTTN
jgi:hypothetical protein